MPDNEKIEPLGNLLTRIKVRVSDALGWYHGSERIPLSLPVDDLERLGASVGDEAHAARLEELREWAARMLEKVGEKGFRTYNGNAELRLLRTELETLNARIEDALMVGPPRASR